MAKSKSDFYSSLAEHFRSALNPEDLKRAESALRRAAEARRNILNLHRSNYQEENDAKSDISDLLDNLDVIKLNKLFRSPINILPSDMRYSEKYTEKALRYFNQRSGGPDDSRVTPVVVMSTPLSEKFDSLGDFDAWKNQLLSANPIKTDDGQHIEETNLSIKADIEQCVSTLRTFERKFADVDNLPEIPNKLNEKVHKNITQLSQIMNDIDQYTQAKVSLVKCNENMKESVKTVPATKTSQDIEEILCQVENLAFPNTCED